MLAIISKIFLGGPRKPETTIDAPRPRTRARRTDTRERSRYQCQFQNPRSYSDCLIFRA